MTPCKYPAANKSPAPVKSTIFKFFLASYSNISWFLIAIAPFDPLVITRFLLSSFENDFIGITGEPEKIYLLSQSWGILSQKIFLENGEYNIDHSSPVILLKNGKYVERISHRDDIKKTLKIFKKFL